MTNRRWVVVCDDETWYTRTREEARELARRIAAHPGTRDIRRFGPYRNATGRIIVRKVRSADMKRARGAIR